MLDFSHEYFHLILIAALKHDYFYLYFMEMKIKDQEGCTQGQLVHSRFKSQHFGLHDIALLVKLC
jgi:hypothetical protein